VSIYGLKEEPMIIAELDGYKNDVTVHLFGAIHLCADIIES
jgi:hypothetical protein